MQSTGLRGLPEYARYWTTGLLGVLDYITRLRRVLDYVDHQTTCSIGLQAHADYRTTGLWTTGLQNHAELDCAD